jgi:hypothetical protein
MESFCWIREEILRDARNKSDHGLLIAIDCLNEAEVILVDSTFDPDPLVGLKPLFLDNCATFHNLGHFIDWNHLN